MSSLQAPCKKQHSDSIVEKNDSSSLYDSPNYNNYNKAQVCKQTHKHHLQSITLHYL